MHVLSLWLFTACTMLQQLTPTVLRIPEWNRCGIFWLELFHLCLNLGKIKQFKYWFLKTRCQHLFSISMLHGLLVSKLQRNRFDSLVFFYVTKFSLKAIDYSSKTKIKPSDIISFNAPCLIPFPHLKLMIWHLSDRLTIIQ